MSEEEKAPESPSVNEPEQQADTPSNGTQTKSEKKSAKKERDDKFDATTSIHVKVYSPFQTYYDDEAESISAENMTGPFDILPRHRNFITLLIACELDIKSTKGGDKKIAISRGVMHVRRNIVTVFLDV